MNAVESKIRSRRSTKKDKIFEIGKQIKSLSMNEIYNLH